MSFYIPYALPHVTIGMVTGAFESIFGGEVSVNETIRQDRDTGRDFKLFWINIKDANKHIDFFTQEIKDAGFAKITYERTKGQDRYWKVKLNEKTDKPDTAFVPRILPRN
jgi:hypothetical protein